MTDKNAAAEMAPDPDEDDLSDLDDMLDEFAIGKKPTESSKAAREPSPAAASKPPSAPSTSKPEDDAPPLDDAELAKQLQAGMEALFGQLGSDPKMQAEFADLLRDLDKTTGDPSSDSSATIRNPRSTSTASTQPSATSAPPAEDAFQSTIRRTMERMQTSGASATAAASSPSSEEDMLAALLRDMASGKLPDGSGEDGSEADLNAMLSGMMEQLTTKEILYEPMRDLHDKFPTWMAEHAATTPPEDLERYKVQQGVVGEIVARFEANGYSDANQADRDFIVERMQRMQNAGSPPAELVGDVGMAQDMFAGAAEEGCPQQ